MTGADGTEQKRRYPRFSVDLMSISGRMMRATEVTILNVSADEVTLVADLRLNLGHHYSLRLSDSTDSMNLRGAVLWSELKDSKQTGPEDFIPQYKAAIKLQNATAVSLAKLQNYIEHRSGFGTAPQATPGPGGAGDCRVVMNFPEGYRVKKISMGGALIETGMSVETEKRFPMEVTLPGGKTVSFQGRVTSCFRIRDDNAERYDVGIEFLDLQEVQRDSLAAFMRSLKAGK